MKFEDMYSTYEVLTTTLCEQGVDPLECAGVMMGQAMKMYKTVLNAEEFDALMEVVVQTTAADLGHTLDSSTNQTCH